MCQQQMSARPVVSRHHQISLHYQFVVPIFSHKSELLRNETHHTYRIEALTKTGKFHLLLNELSLG